MTDDLITWLRAQLDADERVAATAAALQADPENGWGIDGAAITPHIGVVHENEAREHVARYNPKRMRDEVDAKRRILDEHEIVDPGEEWQHCRVCHDNHAHDAMRAPCRTLRLLAIPYADRPGYRSEWTP